MFSCLWHLWDWLDSTSMENKKGAYVNSASPSANDTLINETIPKHVHQHNTAPQHLRLLQYGLKVPNHQHTQLNCTPSQQYQSPPVVPHVHQYQPMVQSPTHQHQSNMSNLYQNQVVQQQYLHHHQKSQNQQNHYYYTNTNHKSPSIHTHISHDQNSQVWAPHQPPGHYHPQQPNKPELQTLQQSNKSIQQIKQKDIERKRSNCNTNQQLRSPSAKRPIEAPVTIQGWLYKQGSDGLMLWKKRCNPNLLRAIIYLGPEEEKLLGSILLPSYKVTLCGSEHKVNRKYAFKCEHANMRTYILAADSQELMMQWVHHLNMACLLQTNSETDNQLNQPTSTSNLPAESSTMRQLISNQNHRNTPVHMHSSSNTTDFSNFSQQEYSQPLYANAPPKPRRLTDGYSSPGSEMLDRYSGESKYVTLQQPSLYQPVYGLRNTTKSPINIYGNLQVVHPPLYNKHLHVPEYNVTPIRDSQNVERRTPDTYGRSKLNLPKLVHSSDYEDVYGDQTVYKRPLSPMAYSNNSNRINSTLLVPVARPYTSITMRGPKDTLPYKLKQSQKIPSIIPRPHSADFLEYEIKHQNSNVIARQPRPKSSLDINRHTSNDNYFYTEERYAEKMRKSAQYLPKMSKYSSSQNEYTGRQWSATYNKCDTENSIPMIHPGNQSIIIKETTLQDFCQESMQPVRSRSVLSDGSVSKEVDMDLQGSSCQHFQKEPVSPAFRSRKDYMYEYNSEIRKNGREFDQFTRSASARLAQNCSQSEGRSMNREGERKREESMKRLLEWKQRMLQSPLNRKVNQGTCKAIPGKTNYYRNNENGYCSADMYTDTGKSANVLSQYNSYSSDDEENEDGSKENVQTQAGRTTDTYPSISEPHIPALIASTAVFNSLPTIKTNLDSSNSKLDVAHQSDAVKELPVVCTEISEKDVSIEKNIEFNTERNIFEKPLKIATNNSTHTALVSSLRSEFSNKFETSLNVMEIKSNGALIKCILAEFEKTDISNIPNASDDQKELTALEESILTPIKTMENIEENYMTMTPKKSILQPSSSFSTLSILEDIEIDENPYVEMTQGSDISLLEPTNEVSKCINEVETYETVCFSDGKLEPVYVEVNQITSGKNSKNVFENSRSYTKLPDILIASQNKNSLHSKSDSSDADDEASKDLDSLDTLCHPRFSLSDTFRPASYYLGVSGVAPELQDSSDSELVSPPPIPTSPPPLDELDQDVSLTEHEHKDDLYRYSHRTSDIYKQNLKNTSTPSTESRKPISVNVSALLDQDNSSLYSMNIDTDQRYDGLSHNSDSDIELRFPHLKGRSYEKMLKRRPVSEELYGELDSLDSNTNETIDSFHFDKHLKHLEVTPSYENFKRYDVNQSVESFHDYENMYVNDQQENEENHENMSTLINIHSRDNSRDTGSYQLTSNSYKSDSSERRLNDFVLRTRPESSSSILEETYLTSLIRPQSSAGIQEINSPSFFFCDNQSKQPSLDSLSNQPAPYYYSDLSINTSRTDSASSILTLNNQRSALNGGKRDITRIINPIRCNNHIRNSLQSPHYNSFDASSKLAAEARSASVDFLNIADKSGNIDKKNIYESDTLKRLKATDCTGSLQSKSAVLNFYPGTKIDKFIRNNPSTNEPNVRRSYSLEGLLENVLNESIPVPQQFNGFSEQDISSNENIISDTAGEGSHLWEEDSIWHERLRHASQRHTRSLDDLDSIGESIKKPKKQSRGISRLVTYVNDNMFNMPIQDKQQMEIETKKEDNKTISKENSIFTIDREKLRQWDFLSSAPSDTQLYAQSPVQGSFNSVVDLGAGACESSEQSSVENSASGPISITRETFPRSVPAKKVWTPTSKPLQSKSITNLHRGFESDSIGLNVPQQGYTMSQGCSQQDLTSDTSQSNSFRKANWQLSDKMNVSAGELLGRTHEELVLLLIQLRRQSANNCNAIEACYSEIDNIQSRLPKMDIAKRLENLQKLEQIKQHLLELEKQYEKGKPLVNLVDNMVKLGSLYRFPKDNNSHPYVKHRIEFNQHIQERRLLAEERRDWNRLSSNHSELHAKVQQLYQLDHLIQEESETLQGLQQDKEEIERALGGLRHRLIKGFKDPAEIEQARKQQIILENELTRVHSMLAQNSRKLEETVAGNARLEQELLVLKQKLQISRQQRSSPQISNAGDSLPCVIGTSAMLESDLHRVQQKVGDLQRQRQEISMQVRQLTDRSSNLQQNRLSSIIPTVASQGSNGNKKKINLLWRETDLDTMNSIDHGDLWDNSTNSPTSVSPLLINTNIKQNAESDYFVHNLKCSDSSADDTIQNTIQQEKQEIKTVRIVKRESERRQRDREKTSTGKWDIVAEEEDASQNPVMFYRTPFVQKAQSNTNLELMSPNTSETDQTSSGILSRQSSISNPSLSHIYSSTRIAPSTSIEESLEKSVELSPIFKSEAARQIITEMSTHDNTKRPNRRVVPKEKRRHYTAPHNGLIMKSLNQLPTDDKTFERVDINVRRARDDLDMERALRQRIDAPDVVRSTLSNKELKYNESTIDNILGTPNKIIIPERYIPEQLPQLSAEEQQYRLRKVESIKKMLSDTAIISGSSANLASSSDDTNAESTSNVTNKATSKIIEEKKQREHLLQLNQILAKQVMEMSKIVAVKALASLPVDSEKLSSDEDDTSPETPLPIYQQRDNYYS